MRAQSVLRTSLAGASGAHTSFEILHRFPPQLPQSHHSLNKVLVKDQPSIHTSESETISDSPLIEWSHRAHIRPLMPSQVPPKLKSRSWRWNRRPSAPCPSTSNSERSENLYGEQVLLLIVVLDQTTSSRRIDHRIVRIV